MGFETPTDIQSQTIPQLVENPRDFIGLAQTGTGKTAAFGLPLLELIDANQRETQALVLAPTRELAQQIAVQLEQFSKYAKGLKTVCVFGGANIRNQIMELKRGAQIIVATPGRLIDLMERRAIHLDKLDFLVLDEADEMLNMGFKDQLETILKQTPEEKHTWLFSATMPREIQRISQKYMSEPLEVRINPKDVVNQNISHQFAVLKASDKTEALRRMLDFDPELYGLVFCRTKRDTLKVAGELTESGYSAEALNGDMSQQQRDAAMGRFRAKTIQVLVATDVAARGIDVNDLTHVIHFALPDDAEYYTHRSGRTARAGKEGISLALITKGEMRRVKYLENKLKINFEKALIPATEDIAKNRIEHWATKVAQYEHSNLDAKVLETAVALLADFSKEEIIAKMVARQMERISKRNSISDLNQTADQRGGAPKKRHERDAKGREMGMQRHFINLGQMDNLNKGTLLRWMCDNSGLTGNDIGRISIEQKHSFVDISEEVAMKAKALNDKQFDGREIRINRDEDRPRGGFKKGNFKKKGKGKKGPGKFKGKRKKY